MFKVTEPVWQIRLLFLKNSLLPNPPTHWMIVYPYPTDTECGHDT